MELFTDKKILEEDYRVDDLLNFNLIVESYKRIIDNITINSLIGIVGRFGSGKSVLLHLLSQKSSQYKWVHFDAWKYPERKELWEGFVLEFGRQVDPKLFKDAKAKIDGTKSSASKQLLAVVGNGLNFIFPGASVIEKFSYFFKSSPAKRVDEIQEILVDIIKKVNEDICIVVEDIDRSGDKGIFFLETLRNFIKEHKFNHKILVICPIGDKQFNEEIDSYGKSLDYIYNFNLEKIDLTNFFKNIFVKEIADNDLIISQIKYLFEISIKKFNLTIREIKNILRKLDIEFSRLPDNIKLEVDIPILLLFIIEQDKNYKRDLTAGSITTNNFWAGSFILMVATSTKAEDFDAEKYVGAPIFITNKEDFLKPCYINNTFYNDQKGYYLTNIFNYLI